MVGGSPSLVVVLDLRGGRESVRERACVRACMRELKLVFCGCFLCAGGRKEEEEEEGFERGGF